MDLVILFISGTVGVGKTTIGGAAAEILAGRRVPHAFVDRDALCDSWPPVGRFNDVTALQNLSAVWAIYRDQGIDRLIVSGVLETSADVDRYSGALGERPIICRLVAPQPVREARLRERDEGASLERHLARTVELDAIIHAASLEDFVVVNDGRPRREVAIDVLDAAGWLASG